jgi:hypothetical protein
LVQSRSVPIRYRAALYAALAILQQVTFIYAYITLLSEQMTDPSEIAHVAIVNALVGRFLISYQY